MARRNADLAGLAALAALGYALQDRNKDLPPVEDRSDTAIPAQPVQIPPNVASTMNPYSVLTAQDVGPSGPLTSPDMAMYEKEYWPPSKPYVANKPKQRIVTNRPATRIQPSAPDPWMDNTPSLLDTNPNMRSLDPLNPDPRSRGRRASVIEPPVYTPGQRYAPDPANLRGTPVPFQTFGMKKGGKVNAKSAKKMSSGGVTVSSASKRGDGIAQKGKTKGRMV